MDSTNDKALIAALVKSHQQYVAARDLKNSRVLESCCLFSCLCCKQEIDIIDPYFDRRYNLADLINACMEKDIYLIMDVLYHPKRPIDVNAFGKDGETALYRVLCETIQNMYDGVEEDDDKAQLFKKPPFYLPRHKYNLDTMVGKKEWVIKILLYSGADINFISAAPSFESGSALHFAVEKGMLDIVKWLVEKGINTNSLTTVLKRTPIMIAALKNYPNIVMYLLSKGAVHSLNKKDARGWTVLHFASGFCNSHIVKSLLIAGADKELFNNANKKASDEALARGRKDNLEILLHHNPFDCVSESIDRLNYLKKAHKEAIENAMKEGRTNMILTGSRNQEKINKSLEEEVVIN